MSEKTDLPEQLSDKAEVPENTASSDSQAEQAGMEQNVGSGLNSNGVYSDADQAVAELAEQGSTGQETAPPDPLVIELRQSRAEAEQLQQEVSSLQDKYLRALADLENAKKRAQKERSDLIRYQGESIVVDLLRVVDELELAVGFYSGQQANADDSENQANQDSQKLIEGLQLIYKNFLDVLKRWDIRSESALGQQFDPQKHMAISKVAMADSQPGTVISELKKLYKYKDKIIRVAEVVVASEV